MDSATQEAFYDELEKIAFIGPAVDLSQLGIPSAIGYAAGRGKGKTQGMLGEASYDEPSRPGKAAKYLLLPGYTGYRAGVKSGREKGKLLERRRKEKLKNK